MPFSHLFTPHEIRGHEIRNRIFSSAHQTILARSGSPGEDMAAYHEARARGGAGLASLLLTTTTTNIPLMMPRQLPPSYGLSPTVSSNQAQNRPSRRSPSWGGAVFV